MAVGRGGGVEAARQAVEERRRWLKSNGDEADDDDDDDAKDLAAVAGAWAAQAERQLRIIFFRGSERVSKSERVAGKRLEAGAEEVLLVLLFFQKF